MDKQSTDITVPKKRGSSRNRQSGHSWERTCAQQLREIGFPHVVSSRSESRSRDDQKIDLINKDEGTNGRLPYNIQCKNTCQLVPYHEILTRGKGKTVTPKALGTKKIKLVEPMPTVDGVINVIFHKYTSNKCTSGKFIAQGEYAILKKNDFLEMIEQLELAKLAEQTRKELAADKKNQSPYN